MSFLSNRMQPPASESDVKRVPSVVAVHGLAGDSFSTWTDKSTGKLWLRDFLPHSTYFVNARVLSFGYDSRAFISPFANASTGRVFTFAEELLGALSDQRVRARGRPIILIGHSLVGIVIKSVCLSRKPISNCGGVTCVDNLGRLWSTPKLNPTSTAIYLHP